MPVRGDPLFHGVDRNWLSRQFPVPSSSWWHDRPPYVPPGNFLHTPRTIIPGPPSACRVCTILRTSAKSERYFLFRMDPLLPSDLYSVRDEPFFLSYSTTVPSFCYFKGGRFPYQRPRSRFRFFFTASYVCPTGRHTLSKKF